jgi:hypothetical protein
MNILYSDLSLFSVHQLGLCLSSFVKPELSRRRRGNTDAAVCKGLLLPDDSAWIHTTWVQLPPRRFAL